MAAAELTIAERSAAPLSRRADNSAMDPFEPQDWRTLMEFAAMISKTAFAPKDFIGKPEACAVAMLYGRQLGIGGLQAIQNIAVINGRPSIYGDAFWAIITSHPEFVDVEEKSDTRSAYVKLTRRNRTPKEVTFTQEQAKTAGLWGKTGPWTNYPDVMLLWRARTFAARALFPDALKGITSNFEAEDSGPVIEGAPITTTPAEALKATAAAPEIEQKITQDTAREFGKAWKASGYTMVEAKAALKQIANVEASLDLPMSKLTEAMKWATKNPNWPNAPVEVSPDENIARELFGILVFDLNKQAETIDSFTKDGKTDWVALNLHLNKLLPVE